MLERTILSYLNKEMDVPAFMEEPEKKPNRYILIGKAGGTEKDHIGAETFIFQSYAETKYEASTLNDKLRAAMKHIIYSTDISRAELNQDYDFSDTDTKRYRYQAVYDFTY